MLLVDGTHSVVVLHDFSSHPTSSDTALDSDDIESTSSSSSSKRISSTTRGFAGSSDDEMVFVIEPVSEEILAIEGEDNEVGEGDNDNSEDGGKEEEEGEWEKDVTSDDDEDDGIPSSTT